MADYVEQFYDLCDSAYGIDTMRSVQIFEEAVRLADSHNDIELAIHGRMDLIQCASFAGCTDRALPAMAWLLAKVDADPQLYRFADQYNLMWRYKWMAENSYSIPAIPLAKIDALIDDMARRYQDLGYDQHAVEGVRVGTYLALGDDARLRTAFARWKQEPRGDMSDCHACEVHTEVKCHLFWGDLDEALRVAKPLFSRRLICEEVPFSTYCRVLMPLFDADRLDLADDYQRRSQRKIVTTLGDVGAVGHHLAFLALTDQANRGVRLLDKHLPDVLSLTEQDQRFTFFTGAAVLLRTLRDQGRETIKLRRHAAVDIEWAEDNEARVDQLEGWFDRASLQIAEQFDRRAGTGYWASLRDRAYARVGNVKPYKRPKKEA